VNRLKSTVLNNYAVSLYLNITDATGHQQKKRIHDKVKEYLSLALKVMPSNAVAMLNFALLCWRSGELRDDQVQYYVQAHLYRHDKELARVFFMLFKKYIMGGKVSTAEVAALSQVWAKKKHVISDAAHQLYTTCEFNHEVSQQQKAAKFNLIQS
jgi:hypothetical protein